MAAATWTADMTDTLQRMWQEGLSCGRIGDRLGVSRNAVAGRISRMRTWGADTAPVRRSEPVTGIKRMRPRRTTAVIVGEAPQLHDEPLAPPPRPARLCRDIGAFIPRIKRDDRPARPLPASDPHHPPEPLDGGVALTELTAGMCRWPVKEHATAARRHLFCGCLKVRGSSYCAYHTVVGTNH